MSEYQVLARKYRPKFFRDVVGQEVIVTTLVNAIKMERTAHAYLFCGSRGTGKTTLARLFAKALNCSKLSSDFEPCNKCASCKEVSTGNAIDVLEIDGASHRGIEDMRQIIETIGYVPSLGKYKIYLIDEVHMLTKEAFNALLKTLEEPPGKVKFLFATTEPHKIPATILSRCQRFNLNRISSEKIEKKLIAIAKDLAITIVPEALSLIAKLSEGSLRDAESLFDQLLAFQESEITLDDASEALGMMPRKIFFALDEAGGKSDLSVAFKIADEVFSSGRNLAYFVEELIFHFRTLLTHKMGLSKNSDPAYAKSAKNYTEQHCLDILELLTEGQSQIKFAPSQRIALEMLLLRILRSRQKIPLELLVQKLTELEKRLESKKTSPPPAAPQGNQASQQSKYDTVMQFASKELGGSLKKG
ncbi:MAG: DNA polymerase III subunit tau [Chlamydiae bacterium]|nr:DNA polymerase III subunit tau [Chlamydiota bacterium]